MLDEEHVIRLGRVGYRRRRTSDLDPLCVQLALRPFRPDAEVEDDDANDGPAAAAAGRSGSDDVTSSMYG